MSTSAFTLDSSSTRSGSLHCVKCHEISLTALLTDHQATVWGTSFCLHLDQHQANICIFKSDSATISRYLQNKSAILLGAFSHIQYWTCKATFNVLNFKPHIFRIRDRRNWSHWQAIMSINAWNEHVLIWIDIFLFQSQPDQLWLCPHQWNYGEALRFLTRLSGMKWISSQSNHYWYVIIYLIFLLCSHHPETR